MELNFADLRTGFSNYLEELYLKEGRELTSTSIFAHSDEFERYVSEELNLGLSMMTISVEDILDIDFSNMIFSVIYFRMMKNLYQKSMKQKTVILMKMK